MKTAIGFLFMSITGFIGIFPQNANLCEVDHPATLNIQTICLQKLVKRDIPMLLLNLQRLMCLYAQGKDSHNEELYKAFLKELNEALKTTGCTLDDVLSTKHALEKLGDNVGKVADQIAFEILTILDDLELVGTLLNFACKLLGDTLVSLSDALGGLNLFGKKSLIGVLLG
ncbi:uncharacterized protein O3C94_009896 [Discoglossus pictus]